MSTEKIYAIVFFMLGMFFFKAVNLYLEGHLKKLWKWSLENPIYSFSMTVLVVGLAIGGYFTVNAIHEESIENVCESDCQQLGFSDGELDDAHVCMCVEEVVMGSCETLCVQRGFQDYEDNRYDGCSCIRRIYLKSAVEDPGQTDKEAIAQ